MKAHSGGETGLAASISCTVETLQSTTTTTTQPTTTTTTTTTAQPANTPASDGPCRADSSSLTVIWKAVEGAHSYEVWATHSSGRPRTGGTTSSTATTLSVRLVNLPVGQYSIRVLGNFEGTLRQIVTTSCEITDGSTTTTTTLPGSGLLAVPSTIWCVATSSSLTLNWAAVDTADSYTAVLQTEEGFVTRSTTGTSATFDDLQPDKYQLYAQANRGDERGAEGHIACVVGLDVPDPPPQEPVPLPPDQTVILLDVTKSHALAAEVVNAVRQGIVTAAPGSNYEPDRPVTRGEIVAPLVRLWQTLGQTCPDSGTRFEDLGPGQLRSDAACLQAAGIATGTSPTTYTPDRLVTRAQTASLLVRMWRNSGGDCPTSAVPAFDDVDPQSVHAANIACLRVLDITEGANSTTFSPQAEVTKAQVAAFGVRLQDLIKKTASEE